MIFLFAGKLNSSKPNPYVACYLTRNKTRPSIFSILFMIFSSMIKRLRRFIYKLLKPSHLKIISAHAVSEEAFLKFFTLDKISKSLDNKDIITARNVLLSHYAERKKPEWPDFPMRMTNVNQWATSKLLEEAEYVLEHRFGPEHIFLGKTVDWTFNPTSDPRARWTRELHRHRWLGVLALAYRETQDERFAIGFVELIISWIKCNPMPSIKNESDSAWTLMGVGMRCLMWCSAFAIFYHSSYFTDEAKLKVLRSVYDHANFLYNFKTGLNHLLRESNGLLYISIYFPEFSQAKNWQDEALRRLDTAVEEQINPDGMQIELSIGYQWLVTEEFDGTYTLLNKHGLRLPHTDLKASLIRQYRALAYLSRPNATWPQLNDGFMEKACALQQRLLAAGKSLEQEDLVFVATQGVQGHCPAETSVGFNNAGLYVMRSGWDQEARYLLFDTGPFGGPHGHEDKLSIEVYAYGQPFIVDSGTYTYNVNDLYRDYFVSSQAHNTVVVAGQSQIRRWKKSNLKPQKNIQLDSTWIDHHDFNYVGGEYNEGYACYTIKKPSNSKVSHAEHYRKILFVKPDYWIIVDEIHSDLSRDFEILFHIAPDINVRPCNNGILCLESQLNDASLFLVPTDTAKVTGRIIKGSTDPIQGWYSDGCSGHKEPIYTVAYTVHKLRFGVFATLIYPTKSTDMLHDPIIHESSVKADDISYVVKTSRGIDYVVLSKNDEIKQVGPLQTHARIACVRVGIDGKIYNKFEWTSSRTTE